MSLSKLMLNKLRAELPALSIKEEEPLKLHTSFRIGGPCELMVIPKSQEELSSVLRVLRSFEVCPLILGAGSNVLAPDEGLSGVVLLTKELNQLSLSEGNVVTAECGVSMARLSNFAMENGLRGLEFAQGIPGSVGGGIFMNAGAYGGQLSDCAVRTTVMKWDGGCSVCEGEAQGFSYRCSAFQNADGIVVESTFALHPGSKEEIRDQMKDYAQRRRSKQPLELPSAGSTFKRPEGYFAGALIEQAGLKGFRIGDAAVSEKHAGFVVNLGNATASDVRSLIDAVISKVQVQFGVTLEPEVRLL